MSCAWLSIIHQHQHARAASIRQHRNTGALGQYHSKAARVRILLADGRLPPASSYMQQAPSTGQWQGAAYVHPYMPPTEGSHGLAAAMQAC